MSRLPQATALLLFALACVAGVARSTTTATTLTYPSTGACAKSSTGLNDCIASADPGSTIVVKPGTYFEHGIGVFKNVTIKGTCGKTIIDANLSGTALYPSDGFDVNADFTTINCITFRHANYAIGLFNGSDNFTATSDTFTGDNYGIGLGNGANNFDIEKSKFIGNQERNIVLDPNQTHVPNNGGKVIGNTFINDSYDGIESFAASDSMTITGNTFTNIDDNAIEWSGDTYPLTNSLISGNTMTGLASPPINLASGSNEDTVSKNTFKGLAETSGFGAINIAGNDATITSNSFLGTTSGYAVNIAGNTATVTNNVIKGGAANGGIKTSGQGPVTVTGNSLAGGFDGNGIEVTCTTSCAGSTVSKNTVSDGYGGSSGITIYDNGSCGTPACFVVSSNTVVNIGGEGYYLRINYSTVSSNKATSGGSWTDSSAFDIRGNVNTINLNTATNNAWDGFSIRGADNIVTNDTATGNGLDGFDIGEPAHGGTASTTTLTHNTATNNSGDGIRVYDSSAANSITVATSKVSGSAGKDCVIHDDTSLDPASSTDGNVCKDGSNFTATETFTD